MPPLTRISRFIRKIIFTGITSFTRIAEVTRFTRIIRLNRITSFTRITSFNRIASFTRINSFTRITSFTRISKTTILNRITKFGCVPDKMHSHTEYTSFTCPLCVFSYDSSNCLPEWMQSHIGCIYLTFSSVHFQVCHRMVCIENFHFHTL